MQAVWKLIKESHFADAVNLASKQLDTCPSEELFFARAKAQLRLRQYGSAFADYLAADALHPTKMRTDGYVQEAGVALWLANQFPEAANVWATCAEAMFKGKISYSDNGGGVQIGCLLWFAGSRIRNSDQTEFAEELLRKKCKSPRSEFWPGPIGHFLLGNLREDELLSKSASAGRLEGRQRCQAHFYIGMKAFSQGDCSRYIEQMAQAAKAGDELKMECEYFLAEHERHLTPDPLSSASQDS